MHFDRLVLYAEPGSLMRTVFVVFALVLGACGSAGGTDGGRLDAGELVDAGDHGLDTGASLDGGTEPTDAGTDAGVLPTCPTFLIRADTPACSTWLDCHLHEVCDLGVGLCCPEYCETDYHCAAGFVCNFYMKTCDCTSHDACKGWPDGRTYCDPATKACTTPPSCDPPCGDCQACLNGECGRDPAWECCADTECTVIPATLCDTSTHQCVECRGCWDACADDNFCKDLKGGPAYVCLDGYCRVKPCAADADCESLCAPQPGTCDLPASQCTCHPIPTGLCQDCSVDATICTNVGMTCGQFTKKCFRSCASTADCVDPYGQAYVCDTGNCDCTRPSCCNPHCEQGQTCDEGVTCICR